MAAKRRRYYCCESCGHRETKWLGRCPACMTWSSFVEAEEERGAKASVRPMQSKAKRLSEVGSQEHSRIHTGLPEFDRVLGGGLVEGGLVLVGGDPGIGKSTLLLQAMGALAEAGKRVLYMSAEESMQQIKMRAERLGVDSDNLFLLTETQLEHFDAARHEIKPDVCVIDSVQTVGVGTIESAVGSVSQIRAVTHRLMQVAKGEGLSTFVVGHVTKDGAIAGPKVMEHMVDTVLYFEGERTGPYRILRAHKNRFGSAQEIGVFEMHATGLKPVSNPSELFLSQRAEGPGAVVVTSLEGTRPILLEVQALTTHSPYGSPRRTSIGFDNHRLAMLCAVLGARAGYELGALDVYVNIAGGIRVSETAADLGAVVALASATSDRAVSGELVIIGEVGLSGEVRSVTQLAARVQEAAALGFSECIVPKSDVDRWQGDASAIPLHPVSTLKQALDLAGLAG